MIDDIAGSAVLPLYEVDRQILAVTGKRIRPFDAAKGFKGRPQGSMSASLPIDAKILMLAAAKTELARSFDFAVAAEQAFGLWIRWRPLLVMDGGPLRLAPPRLFARKDSSTTFDSGRIGDSIVTPPRSLCS